MSDPNLDADLDDLRPVELDRMITTDGTEPSWEPSSIDSIVIPTELYARKPHIFLLKLLTVLLLTIVGTACFLSVNLLLQFAGFVLLGAVYAHMAELEHEVLHRHVFRSRTANRVVGFLMGLPMMISYSHYQYDHLRHHRFLGTPQNREFFAYEQQELRGWGFLKNMFNYSRYSTLLLRVSCAFKGRLVTDGQNLAMERRARAEYICFGLFFGLEVAYMLFTRNSSAILLWLVPLIAAEPIHFLIELPEHYGLRPTSNPDVLENTRTIRGSYFSHWFTNHNTMHTAHHYNYAVPMHALPEVEKIIGRYIPPSSRSATYLEFFKKVITGEIRAI